MLVMYLVRCISPSIQLLQANSMVYCRAISASGINEANEIHKPPCKLPSPQFALTNY